MHKSRLGCIVLDCQTDDLDRDAAFWADVLGAKVVSRNNPGDGKYRGLATDDDAPKILLQQVEHESRVHLDIEADDIEAEVERLENLGAKRLQNIQRWVVMEAPSGHRFCVVGKRRADFDEEANSWSG